MLAGGGLGNAVLFSIGQAMRAAGNRVLYFAAYKHMMDRYKIAEIEAASDVVVWCCDEEPGFTPDRPQDKTFVGNIVQAMHAYASGALGEQPIPFSDADRIIAIGSDRMMAAVARARHDVLKPYLKPHHFAHRLDQLADAMHDEGDLRAVPAAARRSGDGEDELRLLVLQPGPAARQRRLRGAGCAVEAELGPGEAHRGVDRSLSGRARRPRSAADLGAGGMGPKVSGTFELGFLHLSLPVPPAPPVTH